MAGLAWAWLAACGGASTTNPDRPPPPAQAIGAGEPDLRPVAAFASIADPAARSQALFAEASRVLLHPRCVNCHPADDFPRQGVASTIHDPPVSRGPEGRGWPAMRCGSCHQDANAELARIPGAPEWHLAPVEMAWIGRSPAQICEQLKDPARNGGKTLAQIHVHVRDDKLVAWGWAPGADRGPAPGSQAGFAALIAAWIDTGAVCPPFATTPAAAEEATP